MEQPIDIVREHAFLEGVERGEYTERQKALTLLKRLAQAADKDAAIVAEYERLTVLQAQASPVAQGIASPAGPLQAQAQHLITRMRSNGAPPQQPDIGDQVATLVEQMLDPAGSRPRLKKPAKSV